MKRIMLLLLTLLLLFSLVESAFGVQTLDQYIHAYNAEIAQNGEVGHAFNRWKTFYNEAIRLGDEGLYGTKTLQAVLHMTIGVKGNFENNFKNMKANKFLQALAKGDAYDYGLSGVTYLAKAYAKQGGELKQENGSLIASFKSDSKQTSWNIKNPSLLAKELGVTTELVVAWKQALDAYTKRIVYTYTPSGVPQSSSNTTAFQSAPAPAATAAPSARANAAALSAHEHALLQDAQERIQLACETVLQLSDAENISKIRASYSAKKAEFVCYIHIPQSSANYHKQVSADPQLKTAVRNLMDQLYQTICAEVQEITQNLVDITVSLVDVQNRIISKYENGSWY